MGNSNAVATGGQAGPNVVRAAESGTTPPFAKAPHQIMSDRRLTPWERLTIPALLRYAHQAPVATASNAQLAEYVGTSRESIKRRLKTLETAGLIAVEKVPKSKANPTGRVIHLRWVEDPSMLETPRRRPSLQLVDGTAERGGSVQPSTDPTPGGLGQSSDPTPRPDRPGGRVKALTQPHPGGRVKALTQPPGGGRVKALTHSEEVVVVEEELPLKKGPENAGSDSIERQRQRPGRPTAEAPDPAPEPTQPPTESQPDAEPAGPLAEFNLPAQVEFLASLTPHQRDRLIGMTPERRGFLMAMVRDGLARMARGEIPDRAPERAAALPASTADLLAALPGAPAGWPMHAAEALARNFGTAKDRKLWRAFEQVTQAVWRGEFPAESVADAYRQAMGPKAKNRGAVFNTALKNHGWSNETHGQ